MIIWDSIVYINNSVGTLLVVLVAVIALEYARREYRIKNRPFLSCVLRAIQKDGAIYFSASYSNSGNCPAMISFERVVLAIGDEKFPTEVQDSHCVPVSGHLDLQVGHINAIGIQKYRERQYRVNRIDVQILAKAVSVYDKSIGSMMDVEFHVDFPEEGKCAIETTKFAVRNA